MDSLHSRVYAPHYRWCFDVFLSFRGEDTRFNFVSHLDMALRQKGINVFIDYKLPRGEKISTFLLKTIEESKISIVIISKNYASSSWCLDELVKIIDCKKYNSQLVFPIFYKVFPSDVRELRGTFGDALAKHGMNRFFSNKIKAWKEALIEISGLSAWVLRNEQNEAKLIQDILKEVLNELNRRTSLNVAEYPVGIDSQMQDMNLLSRIMSHNNTMIGIYGFGGMGKTTLAKALYNKIAHHFEGCIFIENVREASKQFNGLVKLQEMLLSGILMGDLIKVTSLDRGINIIKDRLCWKKILLVLDNVDAPHQLEVLAGGRDWFGMGSKVIVTTRDKHLLYIMEFDVQHPIQELSNDKALELFSWYAFKKSYPSSYEYLYHSIRAVNYCKGLPLALKVLGSFFCGRNDLSIWEDTLSAYEKKHFLHKDIQAILQISYDGLEAQTKEIFLDICCFLIGKHINDVEVFLKECGWCPKKGITDLQDLSLLTINKASRKIEMHDLIQEMGCTIARLEFTEPHKRKRLFTRRDVEKVLNDNKKTTAVQAIKLNFDQPTELDIDTRGFRNLNDLKFLEFQNVAFSGDLEYLSNTLKWIDWPNFPFSSFPPSYTAKDLIQLKLHRSSIKHLGKGFMNFECFNSIDLHRSMFLKEIPDFSSAVNLQELNVSYCINLVMVHESVGSLSKLEGLTFEGCYNLRQLPSYLKLKSLKYFSIVCCKKLENFPDIDEEMKSTECEIYMDKTAITELPPSIYFLSGLTYFSLGSNSRFCSFPFSFSRSSFFKLEELYLNGCNLSDLSFLEDLSDLAPSLAVLDLSENKFSSLPSCIADFKALRVLLLGQSMFLKEIPKIPTGIMRMHTDGCMSLARFPDNIIDMISQDIEQDSDDDGDDFRFPSFKTIILMNCDVPEWYDYNNGYNLIEFTLPYLPCSKMKAFAPCVVFRVDYPITLNSMISMRCMVFINDILIFDQTDLVVFEQLNYTEARECMWLLVIDPQNFIPLHIDIVESGQRQNVFWTDYLSDEWNVFTVLFKYDEKHREYGYTDYIRCGVHVVYEE